MGKLLASDNESGQTHNSLSLAEMSWPSAAFERFEFFEGAGPVVF
jgi:hypothetical protein